VSDRAEQGGLGGASQESAHAESPARARSFDLARFQTALRAAESATSGAGAGRGRFGRTLVLFDIVASTQEEARALARRGAPDGTVALAEEQSGGRGRWARVWRSPRGAGVWATVVLRRGSSPEGPALLTFAGAVALCEAARALGVGGAEIKWPNDITARGLKLAGILGEIVPVGGRPIALLGFGVNLDIRPGDLPREVAERASSFRAEGMDPGAGREEVLGAILPRLEAAVRDLDLGRGEQLLERWKLLSPSSFGRSVRIEEAGAGAGGDETVLEGITRGVRPDGSLRIETPCGSEVTVRYGGTLELLGPATLAGPGAAGTGEEPVPRRT